MLFRTVGLSLLLVSCSFAKAEARVVAGARHAISSTVLKEERTYRVYLPESYAWAKDRRYPILYVLDGQSQFLHTAASADYLAATGEIPENDRGGDRQHLRVRDFSPTDWPEAWVGGGGGGNFKSFLSQELYHSVERD